MAALYLDEDVSTHVAGELERRGHILTTTAGERRKGSPDPHQLLYAAERNWTLVTHNGRDYRLLHDAWLLWSHRWGISQSHAGTLVMQTYRGQRLQDMADAISGLLSATGTVQDGSLFEWKRSSGWSRFPD